MIVIEEHGTHTNCIQVRQHNGKPGANKTFLSKSVKGYQTVFIIYYSDRYLTNTYYKHFDN